LQAFTRTHYAGFRQLFIVFTHGRKQLLAWHFTGFRILAGFHNDHESHLDNSFLIQRARLPDFDR
jgi:hypothetical protein